MEKKGFSWESHPTAHQLILFWFVQWLGDPLASAASSGLIVKYEGQLKESSRDWTLEILANVRRRTSGLLSHFSLRNCVLYELFSVSHSLHWLYKGLSWGYVCMWNMTACLSMLTVKSVKTHISLIPLEPLPLQNKMQSFILKLKTFSSVLCYTVLLCYKYVWSKPFEGHWTELQLSQDWLSLKDI